MKRHLKYITPRTDPQSEYLAEERERHLWEEWQLAPPLWGAYEEESEHQHPAEKKRAKRQKALTARRRK